MLRRVLTTELVLTIILLMTLGVKEAIHYLPQDDWARVIK